MLCWGKQELKESSSNDHNRSHHANRLGLWLSRRYHGRQDERLKRHAQPARATEVVVRTGWNFMWLQFSILMSVLARADSGLNLPTAHDDADKNDPGFCRQVLRLEEGMAGLRDERDRLKATLNGEGVKVILTTGRMALRTQ